MEDLPPAAAVETSTFVTLRSILDRATPQEDVKKRSVVEMESKEFPPALLSLKNKTKQNRRSVRMDELVQDLNSALDESTTVAAAAAANAGRPKRKLWRRRCKSTSNLAVLPSTSAAAAAGIPQNNSFEETTSGEEGMMEVHLVNQGGGGGGTSSLQLSDSDENNTLNFQVGSARRLTPQYSSSVRKKRASQLLGRKDEEMAAFDPEPEVPSSKQALESDSLNENVSSAIRPNTKRKRKFKRMALDPETAGIHLKPEVVRKPGVTKKLRSRPTVANFPQKLVPTKPINYLVQEKACHATIAVSGKRKRSNREKSVETESAGVPAKEKDFEPKGYRRERIQSSSSLSSSDWDGDNDSNNDDLSQTVEDDDREADDEQSDWPGQAEEGTGMFEISDGEEGEDLLNRISLEEGTVHSLTSTARQAYLARMKRLAECVPGREIRAGSRRLRSRQRGFTIKSSSSEQVARFLQDSRRNELRLTVIRPSDRNKIAHLANLYSLSLSYETLGACPAGDGSHSMLVLTKTGRTLKVNDDELLMTAAPPKSSVTDAKRRRKDCFPDPDQQEFIEVPPEPMISDQEKSTSSSAAGDGEDAE